MNQAGIVECIMANSIGYANGLIGRNTYLKAEKHFVNLLKNN
jgi:tetrahydromethanopterin S-methyltransferase subunit F